MLDAVYVESFLARFKHFKVNLEGLDLHFIHERSTIKDKNLTAIPILLLHGWPGLTSAFVLDAV